MFRKGYKYALALGAAVSLVSSAHANMVLDVPRGGGPYVSIGPQADLTWQPDFELFSNRDGPGSFIEENQDINAYGGYFALGFGLPEFGFGNDPRLEFGVSGVTGTQKTSRPRIDGMGELFHIDGSNSFVFSDVRDFRLKSGYHALNPQLRFATDFPLGERSVYTMVLGVEYMRGGRSFWTAGTFSSLEHELNVDIDTQSAGVTVGGYYRHDVTDRLTLAGGAHVTARYGDLDLDAWQRVGSSQFWVQDDMSGFGYSVGVGFGLSFDLAQSTSIDAKASWEYRSDAPTFDDPRALGEQLEADTDSATAVRVLLQIVHRF